MGFTTADFFDGSNAKDWVRHYSQGDNMIFLATLWWVWRTRNSYCIAQDRKDLAYTITRLVKWIAPPDGTVALNVDDSNGVWLSGFTGYIGISNNLHAELMGIYQGLKLAWEYGYKKICCYSDSLDVICLIQKFIPSHHHYSALICSIRDLLQLQWEPHVIHTLREGNSRVDFLAKTGANSSLPFFVIDVLPNDIRSLLLADAMGTFFLRP
ncbi:hypothetical protein OROGR_026341 [Orobanche gracilis]